MVELKNISFSYGELKILDDFNLSVKSGECICLWGKSGRFSSRNRFLSV